MQGVEKLQANEVESYNFWFYSKKWHFYFPEAIQQKFYYLMKLMVRVGWHRNLLKRQAQKPCKCQPQRFQQRRLGTFSLWTNFFQLCPENVIFPVILNRESQIFNFYQQFKRIYVKVDLVSQFPDQTSHLPAMKRKISLFKLKLRLPIFISW